MDDSSTKSLTIANPSETNLASTVLDQDLRQITHQLGLPVLLVINDQNAEQPNPHPNWSVPSVMHWVLN